mmetsp:Transcript_9657/g.18126  ORF Transcript_9657/g.18126 Transcript_9657/m.18126 type:complete len:224 (-) Transcript_9657:138-809(-)
MSRHPAGRPLRSSRSTSGCSGRWEPWECWESQEWCICMWEMRSLPKHLSNLWGRRRTRKLWPTSRTPTMRRVTAACPCEVLTTTVPRRDRPPRPDRESSLPRSQRVHNSRLLDSNNISSSNRSFISNFSSRSSITISSSSSGPRLPVARVHPALASAARNPPPPTAGALRSREASRCRAREDEVVLMSTSGVAWRVFIAHESMLSVHVSPLFLWPTFFYNFLC